MHIDIAATLLNFPENNSWRVWYHWIWSGGSRGSSVSFGQGNMSCLSSIDSYFAAKLGDTKELEDFIADLDRTLASK